MHDIYRGNFLNKYLVHDITNKLNNTRYKMVSLFLQLVSGVYTRSQRPLYNGAVRKYCTVFN